MNNLNNMHSIFLTDDESIISLPLSGSSVGSARRRKSLNDFGA